MPLALTAPAPFHAAKRGTELLAALLKFGFGEVITQSGLRDHLPGNLKPAAGDPAHAGIDPAPVRLRLLLEELGPTFIKAGQVLATRPDLIPPDWAAELKKLQSDVPPAPWGPPEYPKTPGNTIEAHKILPWASPDADGYDPLTYVAHLLQSELGTRLKDDFRSIDPTPLAAASMAQVHPAVLADGTAVVLKILRPGIQQIIAGDLQLMRWVASLAEHYFSNLGFDPNAVVDEFSRQLERETDLRLEAQSTQRMAAEFAEIDGVDFPVVYPKVSSRGVLALQRVQGQLLARLDVKSFTAEQLSTIVGRAADAVFRQCLSIGFFHADPHPGNLFVDPETCKLTFIDCGMVGNIDPRSAEQLAQIVHGTLEGELDRVVRMAIRLGDADPKWADDRAFRTDVWRFIDHFKGGSLESIRMGAMLDEFFGVLRKHNLRCPADIVYLIKALTTIEGVGQALAPDFDLVGHVRPYVTTLVHRRFGLRALKRRVRNNLVAYADLADELPHHLTDLLRMVRQNRTTLHLEVDNIKHLTKEVDEASRKISWAVVIGSIILGASILIMADNLNSDRSALTWVAVAAYIVAAGVGLIRMIFPHHRP